MTREQVSAFIAACTMPHVKLFAILAATTGARMGAILSLTWDRVDLERGLIHYQDPTMFRTKKGRATTPVNALARGTLIDARAGATTPFVIEWAGQRVRSVKKGIATAGERAGTPWVTAHVFAIRPPASSPRPESYGRDRPAFGPQGLAHGRNCLRQVLARISAARCGNLGILMVGAVGIEPTTPSMSPRCSTAELSAHLPWSRATIGSLKDGGI